jgi:hypothetical protein
MKSMLHKLYFKFGSGESGPPLEFEPGPVTVFVGPTNSGKSLLLREIESYVEMDDETAFGVFSGWESDLKIIEWIEPELPSLDEAERLLLSRQFEEHPYYGSVPEGRIQIGKFDLAASEDSGRPSFKVRTVTLEHVLSNLRSAMLPRAESGRSEFARSAGIKRSTFGDFISLFTIRLDGSTRLALTMPRLSGDPRKQAQNHLWSLAQNENARILLREMTYDAFERYFLIDPTAMRLFRIKLSEVPPPPGVEQSLTPEAIEFFDQATDIADLSDGIKAFTGLTAAVLSTDYKVMLIDEPEAFLHPVLARKLGRRLNELASARESHVLVATHSPDFLMGCIEFGDVDVVRLTYKKEQATARHLSSEKLRQMMRDPLLRSTGVLSGLFHEGVAVCEQDPDRALYQEINHRLSVTERGGAENTLFLNAHEKSTVRRIVQPLRELGIPAAAVVDLDIIHDRTFNNLLRSAFVPDVLVESCSTLRTRIAAKFEEMGLEMKQVGIAALPEPEREAAQTLLDNVAEYGVFIVPTGELERWFPQLRDRSDKPGKSRWVPWVFDLMNTEPELFEIEDGDVWGFIRKIASWISDPERKGIPA